MVTLVSQATVLILVGVAFGLRAPIAAVLLSYVFLVLVAIGLSALSYAVALRLKSEDAFAPLINSVVVPLILLSGVMLPMTLGPDWLKRASDFMPIRWIVDGVRDAFSGDLWSSHVMWGGIWAVILAVLAFVFGKRRL